MVFLSIRMIQHQTHGTFYHILSHQWCGSFTIMLRGNFVNQLVNDRNDVLGEQLTMYIIGVVLVPWNVNYFDYIVRSCVYMMFVKNTPLEVHRCIHRFRFRLLFQWTEDEIPDIHNRISIDNIMCSRQWSPGYYDAHFYERWKKWQTLMCNKLF